MLRLTNIDAIEWLDALVDSEIALLKYKQQDDEIPEQFRKRYVKEQLEQIDACSYVHDPEECPECLKARIKELEGVRDAKKGILDSKAGFGQTASESEINNYGPEELGTAKTLGWQPTCSCNESETVPCVVLDPFAGSGTTGAVARLMGRSSILIELNPEYVKLIRARCETNHVALEAFEEVA
jgi:hypothetical protein